MPQKDLTAFYTPLAIVIAGALIGAGLMFGLKGTTSAPLGEGGPSQPVDIKDVAIEDEPYLGNENAPVILAFWSDFQCPFCKAVEIGHPQIPTEPAIPSVIQQYVDTGKVKIVFKDFAFLGPDSTDAALYGRSVWSLYPRLYFDWRTAMYEAQDEEHGGFGNAASIDKLITSKFASMDISAIKADIQKNRDAYQKVIDANKVEAQGFGISGTPGFITGKSRIDGAQPFSEFQAAIDSQL